MFGPYKCRCCGEIFDEPRVFREYHGFEDFPEIQSCCPFCGGDYAEYDEEVDDEE